MGGGGDMKIVRVTAEYGRQYELIKYHTISSRYGLEAEVEEGEDPLEVLEKLNDIVKEKAKAEIKSLFLAYKEKGLLE